ncbi:MAG: hypothetical protein G01um101418_543 [Parcubacteria group bacterium Gr01-1014_18]|nr:MAG: hypothetical protein Greene041636_589 [Parcubacteria group bacterium Greene0416_36]TSC81006.1 MAG: hypothetical protein G01um101418_543 [Parcubacteria group bacterium Gr01-1014_18]TSC98893.1 MAG: hypothetical protein Greene101420_526 [Parcubacteria group bacterium Greene1014_20]TSD06521.1 MAG: hypothetical protein Greene07142_796 [Parcubacteria group bacterium Greene0714_2]
MFSLFKYGKIYKFFEKKRNHPCSSDDLLRFVTRFYYKQCLHLAIKLSRFSGV